MNLTKIKAEIQAQHQAQIEEQINWEYLAAMKEIGVEVEV